MKMNNIKILKKKRRENAKMTIREMEGARERDDEIEKEVEEKGGCTLEYS